MLLQQGSGLKGRASFVARPDGAWVFYGRSYLGLRPVRRCSGDRAPPQASTARPVRGFLRSAFGELLQSRLRAKPALFNLKARRAAQRKETTIENKN